MKFSTVGMKFRSHGIRIAKRQNTEKSEKTSTGVDFVFVFLPLKKLLKKFVNCVRKGGLWVIKNVEKY